MQIQSTRFGELTVAAEDLLQFSNGLPGFPDEQQFALISQDSDNPFAFLQSINNPDLTFILVDPFSFFNDYSVKLADQYVDELEISEENPPVVFTIVSIREALKNATVNLLAPVVINLKTRQAAQIILEKTDYTTRHKLFPNGLPQQLTEKGGK
ncbi:Flagellar assembly factor FliW [bioreactor metagenome]|uniref:Flagellar assembly factor FliW n=1 Tax=bioreactor metagenome TaxID=1076179 RepID=A0A644W600_9ZZZZ